MTSRRNGGVTAAARESPRGCKTNVNYSQTLRPTPDAFLQPRVMMLSAELYRTSKKSLSNALRKGVWREKKRQAASKANILDEQTSRLANYKVNQESVILNVHILIFLSVFINDAIKVYSVFYVARNDKIIAQPYIFQEDFLNHFWTLISSRCNETLLSSRDSRWRYSPRLVKIMRIA